MYFVDKIMSMHIISNPDFLSLWEKTYAANILTMFSKIKASLNLLAYITVFILLGSLSAYQIFWALEWELIWGWHLLEEGIKFSLIFILE